MIVCTLINAKGNLLDGRERIGNEFRSFCVAMV